MKAKALEKRVAENREASPNASEYRTQKTCYLFGLFFGMGKSEKINIFQSFGKIFRIIIENIIFIDIEMQGKNYTLRQNLQLVLLQKLIPVFPSHLA